MITMFQLSILPKPQRVFLPLLEQVPKRFILYGGTAIALRLGHRESVDFDFFSSDDFNHNQLVR